MILTRSEVRLLCISQCLVTLSVPDPDLHWAPVHLPERKVPKKKTKTMKKIGTPGLSCKAGL